MIQFKKRMTTTEIILHDSHTVPSSGEHSAVSVLRWKGRKLGLLEIGYHFVIDQDGTLTETRPMALVGSHCRGHDMTSIGICLIGGLGLQAIPGGRGFDSVLEDNFTPAQKDTLFALVQKLRKAYGPIPLMGHGETTRSTNLVCPPCDMTDLRSDYGLWLIMQQQIAHAQDAEP